MRIQRFIIGLTIGVCLSEAFNACGDERIGTTPATAPATRPADEKGMKLIWATVRGHKDEALTLIKQGADVNVATERGSTPLWFAVAWGGSMLDVVKELVEHGANVNTRCVGGATPLHQACGAGNADVVAYLISKGADVTARETSSGDTPLHIAASELPYQIDSNQLNVIGLLLLHGADVNAVDKRSETPLDLANERTLGSEAAKLLISKGGKSGNALVPPATQKSR